MSVKAPQDIPSLICTVTDLMERVARLEVEVSELRYKAGITQVDEVYEQVMSDRPLLSVDSAQRCEQVERGEG